MEAPKNKAAVLTGPNTNPLDIRDVPMREPRPGYVVIKTAAVAIAPVDYVMQDSGMFLQDQDYPFILGCDVAGTVHASASDRFSSGERVMGHANAIFSHDMAEGAFQHYVLVSEELMAKIPDRMEFKDAVVLPLSITTAAAGLYPKDLLGLPHPSLDPKPSQKALLVWGGSSSVGSSTIQLAVASGLHVLTTASKKHAQYCKALGAAQVFDHNDADIVDQLVKALKPSARDFAGVYDAIATSASRKPLYEMLQRLGGGFVASVRQPEDRLPKGVTSKMISAPWILVAPGQAEAARTSWRDFVPQALEKGILKPAPPALVVGTGLEKVQEALDLLKRGVSGQKVVVEI